jgi:hypothetical protein
VWIKPQYGHLHVGFRMSYLDLRVSVSLGRAPMGPGDVDRAHRAGRPVSMRPFQAAPNQPKSAKNED